MSGWQADGSYIPCLRCGWVPAPDPPGLPGVPLYAMPRTPGSAIHRGDCPTVALPPEVEAKLRADLAEMDRLRRRAAAEARFYVIG